MGSRDHSIECETCGESYGGMNAESEEHECDPARDFAVRFEMGTVEFKCPRCVNGTVSDMYCSHCDGNGVLIEYVKTWFDNLANAAALCVAFEYGRDYESSRELKAWRPGCGRAAPGWRSE